jgi:hypothetical protein
MGHIETHRDFEFSTAEAQGRKVGAETKRIVGQFFLLSPF